MSLEQIYTKQVATKPALIASTCNSSFHSYELVHDKRDEALVSNVFDMFFNALPPSENIECEPIQQVSFEQALKELSNLK